MPTLIFILLISYTVAFASSSHDAQEKKPRAEVSQTTPREPASVKEAEISNEDAEKLLSALEEVDQELRQLHTGHAPTPN